VGGVSIRVPAAICIKKGVNFVSRHHAQFTPRHRERLSVTVWELYEAADGRDRDGDCIHVVIKGSAINNDGLGKLLPCLCEWSTWTHSAVRWLSLETVNYIEVAALEQPDPIEITAPKVSVLRRKGLRATGSVKNKYH